MIVRDVATRAPGTAAKTGSRPRKRESLPPSRFWAIGEPVERGTSVALPLSVTAMLLFAWAFVSRFGHIPAMFLPSPGGVWNAFAALLADGYAADIRTSCTRVAIGFAIAALLSIPIGVLMGSFGSFEAMLAPIVGTLRYLPITALVPLLILWLGIDEAPKLAIIVLSAFFYNTIMIVDAVHAVPKDFINVSYTLGAKRLDVLWRVILPAAMPQIFDALRVNVAVAWNFLFIAELVAADSGMGYRLTMAQRTNASDQMFVALIIVAIVGFALDRAFRLARRIALPWAA
ncbi:MAG: ABC transporter permease [Vulcanimicrobiaceae bacterium]